MKARTAFGFGLAAIMAAGVVARRIVPHVRAVRAVPLELRSPMLYLNIEVTSRPGLRLVRRLPRPPDLVAPGVEVEKREVPAREGHPGTQVYVYDTPTRPRPTGVLLWIHGGGYVMGDPRSDHDVCSQYARDLGIVVVSAEYRLAPEHPFPAGLEDCYAALRWVHENAEELGIDRNRIAVGGGSAGGGLAAALAQLAHDRGGRGAGVLPVPRLPDARRPHDPGPETPENVGVDTRIQSLRLDLLPRTPAARPGGSSVRGPVPASGPERTPAGVDRRRRQRPVLRRGCRVRGRLQAAGVRCQLDVVPSFYHGAFGMAPADSVIANGFRDSERRWRKRWWLCGRACRHP